MGLVARKAVKGWKGHVSHATLSVAARQVAISGGDVKAAFTAKSVADFLGGNAAELTIYTGNALIKVMYHNGRYYAVVKPLGAAGLQRLETNSKK